MYLTLADIAESKSFRLSLPIRKKKKKGKETGGRREGESQLPAGIISFLPPPPLLVFLYSIAHGTCN